MKKFLRNTSIYRLYKKLEASFSWLKYGFPTKWLKCIWVTGTDGKTTSNELIYHILKKSWKKVWIMSTISLDVGKWKWKNKSKNKLTSLTHNDFNKYLKEAKKNWIEYMVVEPSSHAIHQYRFRPAKFIAVWITNLTHEHLDFHKTMDNYFKIKSEIFRKKLRKNSIGVAPQNFEYLARLKEVSEVSNFITFDQNWNSDIYVENIREHPELEVTIVFKNKIFHTDPEKKWRNGVKSQNTDEWLERIRVKTKLVWLFNLDNIMISASICRYLWVSLSDIQKWIESFHNLPWRQDLIKTENNITFMIDFALTPHALKQLYTSMKKLPYERQIAIFGATGDRDKEKRPIMWALSTEINDYTIITEDENYSEDGTTIISEIEVWISPDDKEKYKIIQDRREAIATSIKTAKSGDLIIITWMWNFESRKMWKKQIPRNDEKVLCEELEKAGLKIISSNKLK